MRENEPFILHMKDRPTIYGLSEDNGTPDDDSASVDGGITPAGEQDASVLTICPSLLFQMMKRVKRATGQLITQKKKKGSRLEVVSKDVGVLTIHPCIITISDDEEGEEGYRAANTPEEEGISAGSGEQGCRCPDDLFIITISDDEEGEEGYRAANTPEEEGISAGSGEQGCRCPDNLFIITISDDEEGEEAIQNEDLATMTMFLCSLIIKYCNFN